LRAIWKRFAELKSRKQKAFIPFITAGDPDLETTVRLVSEMEQSGSDIVELGIPFSDPVADGPTIQRSSERALAHRYRISDYLAAVSEIRRSSEIPIVLFSYFNPIFQFGMEGLARDAAQAGVDGVLVTDLTPEEGSEYCVCMDRHGLDTIFLAAPTSDDGRLSKIISCTHGFLYLVSRTGITGEQNSLSDALAPTMERVRNHTDLPVAVGFGISTPEHVKAVWQLADGAVVGSAIVAQIEKLQGDTALVSKIGAFCHWLLAQH
jgi:tryptophan synthase alpha chain